MGCVRYREVGNSFECLSLSKLSELYPILFKTVYSIPYTVHTNSAKLGQVTSRISGVLADFRGYLKNGEEFLDGTFDNEFRKIFRII